MAAKRCAAGPHGGVHTWPKAEARLRAALNQHSGQRSGVGARKRARGRGGYQRSIVATPPQPVSTVRPARQRANERARRQHTNPGG